LNEIIYIQHSIGLMGMGNLEKNLCTYFHNTNSLFHLTDK